MKKDIFLFVLLMLLLYVPPSESDLWWHLRYGEIIFNTRSVQTTDSFSHTMFGYSWANSYWLSELIMHILFKIGGLIFIPLVFSLFLSLSIVWISKKVFKESYTARLLACVFVAYGFHISLVSVRPMGFSIIFLAFMWFTFYFEQFKKYAILLPLLFLIWANMHADFIIGLSIFAVFVLFKTIKVLRGGLKKETIYPLFMSLVLSVAVTFFNPFGPKLYQTMLQEVKSSSLQNANIVEWMPLTYKKDSSLLPYAVVLYSIVLFVLLYKRKSPFVIVVFLVSAFMSIRSVYFVRVFSVLSFPILYEFFYEALKPFYNVYQSLPKKIYSLGLLVLFLEAAFLNLHTQSSLTERKPNRFPAGAVRFIKERNLSGNMFNPYGWGGYLIYFMPEHKTFIDGRMPSWEKNGENIFKTYLKAVRTDDFNVTEEVMARYSVSFALIEVDKKLYKHMSKSESWEQVYKDDVSAVFLKK